MYVCVCVVHMMCVRVLVCVCACSCVCVCVCVRVCGVCTCVHVYNVALCHCQALHRRIQAPVFAFSRDRTRTGQNITREVHELAVSVHKVAIFSRVPETQEILDRNRQFVDLCGVTHQL